MLLIKALLIKTKVRMRLLAGLKLTFFVRNSVQTMVGGSVGGKGHSTFISSFKGGGVKSVCLLHRIHYIST